MAGGWPDRPGGGSREPEGLSHHTRAPQQSRAISANLDPGHPARRQGEGGRRGQKGQRQGGGPGRPRGP
eukprot:113138-Alexandrium_andersonii.AAC.1